MPAFNKITILLHHHDRDRYPGRKSHLIWYLVDCWREMGIEIDIAKGLPPPNHQFDILFPHINLTQVPQEYVEFIDANPRVLNRKITDISKRHVSRNLEAQVSDYNGPVIVKTNNNHGGLPESLTARIRGKISNGLFLFFKQDGVRKMNPINYEVYDSKADVPGIVWRKQNLVVERFIPERQGGHFCIRICHFMGDIMLNNRIYSKSKVIKSDNIEFVEPAEIPPAIRQIRNEMGFDYGKLDYVVHNGEVHILDVNKTPGVALSIELNSRIALKLAKGIEKYLDPNSA